MLQRIGIAQALIHKPDFVILDEPMTGLDPDGRFEVREIIREVAQQGTAVFFSSHLLPDAEQLCRRLVIVKKGEMVFEGGTHELLDQVQRGWVIHWRSVDRMSELKSQPVANLVDLQLQIDTIRKQGGQIEDVTRMRASLEEIFMKIGFEDSALLKSQQVQSHEVAR
jgi:ABC-2 type transport system ATP-binding protein